MSNVKALDELVNFCKYATTKHWSECFGRRKGLSWKVVIKNEGLLATLDMMPQETRNRWELYLINHWHTPPPPDVEWTPISEHAIIPKLDNKTVAIDEKGNEL